MAQGAPTPAKPVVPNANATQAAPPSAPAEANVPADVPVITINGVCDVSPNGLPKPAPRPTSTGKAPASSAPSASRPDCKTQITRAEFEKLLKTVASGAPANVRKQVAARYVQFITAANEGIKLGVDKDPEFSEQLALMRLQLLAQDAERKLQAEASNVSDADIKAYYDQNPTAFEEVTLTRIFVPRGPTPPVTPPGSDSKAAASPAP